MATTRIPGRLTVDELADAVKRLTPAELHEFTQRLAEWQGRNGSQMEAETVLLKRIGPTLLEPGNALGRHTRVLEIDLNQLAKTRQSKKPLIADVGHT